jgi:hypothetical protein
VGLKPVVRETNLVLRVVHSLGFRGQTGLVVGLEPEPVEADLIRT